MKLFGISLWNYGQNDAAAKNTVKGETFQSEHDEWWAGVCYRGIAQVLWSTSQCCSSEPRSWASAPWSSALWPGKVTLLWAHPASQKLSNTSRTSSFTWVLRTSRALCCSSITSLISLRVLRPNASRDCCNWPTHTHTYTDQQTVVTELTLEGKQKNFTTDGVFLISEQLDSDVTWDGAGVPTFDLTEMFLGLHRCIREVLCDCFWLVQTTTVSLDLVITRNKTIILWLNKKGQLAPNSSYKHCWGTVEKQRKCCRAAVCDLSATGERIKAPSLGSAKF